MVLAQMRNGVEHVIEYASRGLRGNEKFFSITQLESLAVVEGCKKFTRFLELQPFEIVTDHAALQWVFKRTHKDPQCPRLARMALALQGYDFTVKFRAGSKHTNGDYLSRLPADINYIAYCQQRTMQRSVEVARPEQHSGNPKNYE